MPAEEAPDWLQEFEQPPVEAEALPEEVAAVEPEPAPVEEAVPAEEAPDWLQEFEQPPVEAEALPEEVSAVEPEPAPVEEAVPAEEAPDWLQEFEQPPVEAEALPEEVAAVEPEAAPIEEAVPAEEAPDWLQELGEPSLDTGIDWLQEIEDSEIEPPKVTEEAVEGLVEPAAEIEEITPEVEGELSWQPEFAVEEEPPEKVIEPSEPVEFEALIPDLEESFDWLEESAREITPEPEMEAQPLEPSIPTERIDEITVDIEEPLDDDQIDSFLEGLAAREVTPEIPTPTGEMEVEEALAEEERVEEKLIEEHIIPEELDESLMWLEQLAGEEPVDEFQPPIFIEETEGEEVSEVPEWLEEVAEKPEELAVDSAEFEEAPMVDEAADDRDLLEPDLSSMDTIISRRPIEEPIVEDEIAEEIIEEPIVEDEIAEEIIEEPQIREESPWEILPEEEPQPTPDLGVEKVEEAEVPIPEPQVEAPIVPSEPDTLEEEELKERTPALEGTPPVPSSPLESARSSLERGEVEEALSHYTELIEENKEVSTVIEDLRRAIDRTPEEPMLWQTLGDALMKMGQLSDAIDAYRRGMEAV
jgi:tetratricopeptide (TPR) repeat protein